MTPSRAQRNPWALGGALFAAFFIAGDVLRGPLASGPLPLPTAPAAEDARYFAESRTAVLVVALCQVLSAVLCWLGLVQATLAILSLASLLFFPAALLILLGRMLGFVWCVAVGIVLALGARRGLAAGA